MQHRYAPMRQVPVASEEEVQAMLARMKRRLQANAVSGELKAHSISPAQLPDGAKPSPTSAPIGASLSTPQAAQSPKEKSVVKLEWERPTKDATAVKTKCGRYSCCKVTIGGKVHYELWRLAPGAAWFTQLHNGLDNFLQAQELARQDAERRA